MAGATVYATARSTGAIDCTEGEFYDGSLDVNEVTSVSSMAPAFSRSLSLPPPSLSPCLPLFALTACIPGSLSVSLTALLTVPSSSEDDLRPRSTLTLTSIQCSQFQPSAPGELGGTLAELAAEVGETGGGGIKPDKSNVT